MARPNFIKGDKKVMNAWAFYDWANSVYSLVISSAIFPIFWGAITINKETGYDLVNVFGLLLNNEAVITYTTGIAIFVVVILSPILSGVADYTGNKKFYLKLFCYLGGLSSIALYFFDHINYMELSLFFYLTAIVGFWCSLVFYNSYLPDIAPAEIHDKLSAKGFSLGYLGAVILLLISLVLVMKYQWFGIENELEGMKISFALVGVWWISFSQYTYKYLPDFKNDKKVTKDILLNGYNELLKIWKQIKEHVILKKYLGAFFVYSMGVQTVMLVATYFGVEEIEWGKGGATLGLIISILLIQIIAIGGAYLTSFYAKKFGNISVLIVLNLIWVGICICAYFIHTPIEFYVTASFVGLVMGGIQSLSRSTFSKYIPENTLDTTSYFSFYDVSEKIGIIIGMFLYGYVVDVTGSSRFAILFFVAFFVLGSILLFRIPKK